MDQTATSEKSNYSEQTNISRALRLQAYGGPETLTVDNVAVSEPGPGEVLVAVKAAAVNGIDWKIREGNFA
ncbi:hypothetical protein RMR21_022075 [Agrobacterium sp. rho-8.1]|nr:hypothetical protein [Agrobacterium sp. rho-8.1]